MNAATPVPNGDATLILPAKSLLRAVAALVIGLMLTACGGPETEADPSGYTARPRSGAEPNAVYEARRGGAEVARIDPAESSPANGERRYTMDAMIGQVNGKPIYASEVFRKVGMEQLARLGERNDPRRFVQEIQPLMSDTLRQMVNDALLLAEAEASLTEQEEQGLLGALRQYREQLISEAGGFLGGAEAKLRRERGMTLSEAVEERRQEILVQKYMRERLFPKVNVDRREVERYYRDHPEQFNPAAEITVRLLIAPNPEIAERAAGLIEAEGFDAAAEQLEGELMAGADPRTFSAEKSDFDQLAFEPLNEQIRELNPGEVSPRLDLGQGRSAWVKMIEVQQAESKPLTDVYLDIEQRLRASEFERANRGYMRQLREKGNFTPIDQMLQTLMVVATNRFAGGAG